MNKKVGYMVATIVMWFIALRALFPILTNHNPASYNGLPMWVVYTLYVIYCFLCIFVTIRTGKEYQKENK